MFLLITQLLFATKLYPHIKLDKRIRDIIEMNDGRIALLTDRGKKLNENPEIIIISKRALEKNN